ncbi:MAG: hypothetical protein CM15mP49_00110 [Actinomycetota bacterium]|nr:MAG: hypothetical protein CM15mP49_00110 [Actinomycetota bacterium]
MATTAETLGFTGVFVTDHPAPPKSFLDTGGHHTLDPMITWRCGNFNKKIKLLTNLYIVAYRNPLLVAKMVASLDNLSLGRLILGVGAGYLKEEFQATGADYENRGQLLDDYIEIMKQAWTGNPVSMKGYNFEAKKIISLPTPVLQDGDSSPPIWIGGNSKNALERRAVSAKDGFRWPP